MIEGQHQHRECLGVLAPGGQGQLEDQLRATSQTQAQYGRLASVYQADYALVSRQGRKQNIPPSLEHLPVL